MSIGITLTNIEVDAPLLMPVGIIGTPEVEAVFVPWAAAPFMVEREGVPPPAAARMRGEKREKG